MRHHRCKGYGTAADRQRKGERDQTGQQIERYDGSCIKADAVHQDGQAELAAAQPDQPAEATDRHTPSERATEIWAGYGAEHFSTFCGPGARWDRRSALRRRRTADIHEAVRLAIEQTIMNNAPSISSCKRAGCVGHKRGYWLRLRVERRHNFVAIAAPGRRTRRSIDR